MVKYSQTGPLNENSLRYSLGLLTMCFTERHYWCYSLRHIVLFFCVPEIHILLITHLRNKQRIENRLKWLPKFSQREKEKIMGALVTTLSEVP